MPYSTPSIRHCTSPPNSGWCSTTLPPGNYSSLMPPWLPAMALRKRRTTPWAGSPPPSHHHHHATLLVCNSPSPAYSSLKYVLFVTAAALLLLVFAVSHRREAAASCRLCLLGEGAVREYRHGDGGVQQQHLLSADPHPEEDEDDDEGEPEPAAAEIERSHAVVSHVHICPRLFHEKQTTPVDLMHALNNLMQGKDRITREEMDSIAEKHVSTDTGFHHHRDYRENIDAAVIQAVAASRGKTVYFIDSVERLDREIDLLDLRRGDRLLGFLLHLKGRLWIAVRPSQGLWYNFDSTKAAPLLFCEGAHSVHTFLHKVVDDGGLIVALRKPRPANKIMLAEKPPPPSWTDHVEYWTYRLFG